MAIFLPIALEQVAREIGFVAPDLVVPCAQASEGLGVVCKAKILGAWVDTASFR
jgi:UMF1 family MFS transporter